VLGSLLNSVYRAKIGQRLPAGLPPTVVADAHRSVADVLLDATSPKVHLGAQLIGPLVRAVTVTFADGFGLSMLGGAAMLVTCSALVWIFQRRGADPGGADGR
jgi:hypothetical protein